MTAHAPSGRPARAAQRTGPLDVATDDPILASVAGRYASALFDLAKDEGKLAEVERDVSVFQGLLSGSTDLQRLVRSPVISADEQAKAIRALAEKAGIGMLTANFLNVLVRNRRLFTLADTLKAFRGISARYRGEVTAEVTSAMALSEAQLIQLKDTLRIEIGKDVQIDTRVDPALLGGLIVKVGSRMIDSSIRTKLDSLKTRMKEAN
jgi:F-type H+-transporting ATPase subunit delta